MTETRESKEVLLQLLEERNNRRKYNKFAYLFPDKDDVDERGVTIYNKLHYKKHIEFLQAGKHYVERAFIAANRVGKTLTGIYEVICHATGKYPEWWDGKRFNRPVTIWVAGDRGETVRDSIQRTLIGETEIGTGILPKDDIIKISALPGIPGAYGQYFIKHVSGGQSTIVIKTYQSGKNAFEGAAVDIIMLDEECPLDIYVECQMRVISTKGTVYLTFTPDSGLTDTVLHFLNGDAQKYVVMVGWDDVPHLDPTLKQQLLETIPPHLRDVKTKGIPYLGAGAIYNVPETDILVSPFQIPDHWPRVYALDVGWNRTAALWGAWNREQDIMYLYDEYYRAQAEPPIHAEAIKRRGNWIRGVIDPASRGRSQNDGLRLIDLYMDQGLSLYIADNAVEAGIYDVWTRLSTGRLKVFRTLQNWLKEYRIYRRDDKGKVVKKDDHLMDCLRYLVRSGMQVSDTMPVDDDDPATYNRRQSGGNLSITGY